MAQEAKGAEIVEVALAAAFGYRTDVVRVPKSPAGGDGLQPVETESGDASRASRTFQGVPGSNGVDIADGATAAIPREDLVAKVAGVGTEPPLVDAVVAAEGAPPFRDDLEVAPPAEGKAVRPGGERVRGNAAAAKSAGRKHAFHRMDSANLLIFSLGQP